MCVNQMKETSIQMKVTGAALAILRAMKKHSGNTKVQYSAFQALNSLTDIGGDKMKRYIVRKGGLSVIEEVAKQHRRRVNFKVATDDLLAKLSRGIPTE